MRVDLTGKKFGRLVVEERLPSLKFSSPSVINSNLLNVVINTGKNTFLLGA